MTYKTKQKDRILSLIQNMNHAFTVREIYDSIKHEIGLTTIYRMVDKLVMDGVLNKTISQDNITYYEYLVKCNHENHFYLKCLECGTLIHIDCDCIHDLSDHIFNMHKFMINNERIIINGTCNKCLSMERNDNLC